MLRNASSASYFLDSNIYVYVPDSIKETDIPNSFSVSNLIYSISAILALIYLLIYNNVSEHFGLTTYSPLYAYYISTNFSIILSNLSNKSITSSKGYKNVSYIIVE